MSVLGKIKRWTSGNSDERKDPKRQGTGILPDSGVRRSNTGRRNPSSEEKQTNAGRVREPVRVSEISLPATKHLVIPDCQIKPGVPLDHLTALGNYIIDQMPDVIVQIGDFADMHSLSSYDRGTRRAEGNRYQEDIDCAREAMETLLAPIEAYNRHAKMMHRKRYTPRMILTLGNHENRIQRHVDANAELEGKVGFEDLPYEAWEVCDFLDTVEVDGILYSHYFPRNAAGRITQSYRGAPNARLQVLREMQSCTSGHLQGLDFHVHQTGDRRIYGIIAGSFYQHDEDYLTPQGTAYWRGVIVKHEVEDGQYDPMFVSLRYLLSNWR